MSLKKQFFFGLSIVVLILLNACGSDGLDKENAGEISLPPSLNEKVTETKIQTVKLTQEQNEQLNIKTFTVKRDNFSYSITLPGITYPAPDNIFIVSAPISGRIVSVYAHEGEIIQKGEPLMEIESLEFANLVADFLKAGADEDYAITQYDRIEQLVEKNISPYRALDKAEADLTRAKAIARASEARLRAVGVREKQIRQWQGGAATQARLKIYAPISGVLTEHLIDMGQAVNSNEKLLTIIDLDKVLVRGFVSPEDASLIQPGDSLYVTLKDYADKRIQATVKTVNPALDLINKSVTINVIIPTPQQWPKPGQNVRLEVSVTTPRPVISIPLSAVEYEGDLPAVFVKKDQLFFEKRLITVQKITSNSAIVSSGLSGGEDIAISQVFSLKALAKYEEFAE